MSNMLSSKLVEQIIVEAKAYDHSDAAVIATDVHGTVIYWSGGAESLYGWQSGEAIGRNVLDITPTRSSSDEAATIFEQLRLGKTWEGTFILKHRDGTPILAHVTDIPVRVGEEVVGIIGVSRRS